jgi:hypothetical protein
MLRTICDASYQLDVGIGISECVRKSWRIMDWFIVSIAISECERLVNGRLLSTIKPVMHVKERDGTVESASQVIIATHEFLIVRRKNSLLVGLVVGHSG